MPRFWYRVFLILDILPSVHIIRITFLLQGLKRIVWWPELANLSAALWSKSGPKRCARQPINFTRFITDLLIIHLNLNTNILSLYVVIEMLEENSFRCWTNNLVSVCFSDFLKLIKSNSYFRMECRILFLIRQIASK